MDGALIVILSFAVTATAGFGRERFGGMAPLWILNKQ